MVLSAFRKYELDDAFDKVAVKHAPNLVLLLFRCLIQVCVVVVILLNMYDAVPGLLKVEHPPQILRDLRRCCVLSMAAQLKEI